MKIGKSELFLFVSIFSPDDSAGGKVQSKGTRCTIT